MKKNMGHTDKIARLVGAIVMGELYFTEIIIGIPGIVILVIAAYFVITSSLGFCPVYVPLRINTCKQPKQMVDFKEEDLPKPDNAGIETPLL